MKNENLTIAVNLAIIIVFLLPGILVCADSLFMQFLGVVYLWGYWENIGKPVYERYKKCCGGVEE